MSGKAKLLVSACLLGRKTRYDATHKHCVALDQPEFSAFELVAICPEVEIGLGTPRTPINLHERNGRIELLVADASLSNISHAMRKFCDSFVQTLADYNGIILKKNSPSCGSTGVKLYHEQQHVSNDGIGEFAYQIQRHLKKQHLLIPLIDESELEDPLRKHRFLQQASQKHV